MGKCGLSSQQNRPGGKHLLRRKMDTKQCTKCKQIKTIDNFNKDKRYKDGYANWCKACFREYHLKWYDENTEEVSQRSKEWYQENKEWVRPLQNEKTRDKWKNDPEYRKHKNDYKKEYFETHPEYKQIRQWQRAIKAGKIHKKLDGNMFTQEEWQELCTRYNYLCLCCKKSKPLTPDHVIPLCKNGKNTIDNIQPLCKECNDKKGTKTTDYRK